MYVVTSIVKIRETVLLTTLWTVPLLTTTRVVTMCRQFKASDSKVAASVCRRLILPCNTHLSVSNFVHSPVGAPERWQKNSTGNEPY